MGAIAQAQRNGGRSSSWMEASNVMINWTAPSSNPFASMYDHDSSCMIAWRMHAIRTPVMCQLVCQYTRMLVCCSAHSKYGMYSTRASSINTITFTTLLRSQFQGETFYFFRELGRVRLRAAAERLT